MEGLAVTREEWAGDSAVSHFGAASIGRSARAKISKPNDQVQNDTILIAFFRSDANIQGWG
jgi:hypothetical protein